MSELKLTDDQNIKNLKTRKILRRFIMVFCILTIVLAILSLTIKLNAIFPLISFIISTILIKKRENIPIRINENLELKRIEKAMNKQKHKK